MGFSRPDEIAGFLESAGWLRNVERVDFLASGEYNENYRVISNGKSWVFRINHGSQLGLDRQIEYEFDALRAVERSGRTPKPVAVQGASSDAPGVLLMEFIPGRAFIYETDDIGAAELFSLVHTLPPDDSPDAQRLLRQPDSVSSLVSESIGLIDRYPDHPKASLKPRLLSYAELISGLSDRMSQRLQDEPPCIVNTEVNSGNFIVHDDVVYLVDWEKAVVSNRYQDLAHFLIPTTTLWKSDFRYDDAKRLRFLSSYRDAVGTAISLDELSERTRLMERVILLRALSWCYMAYYEYTQFDRPLTHDHTFSRITHYLDRIEWFLS